MINFYCPFEPPPMLEIWLATPILLLHGRIFISIFSVSNYTILPNIAGRLNFSPIFFILLSKFFCFKLLKTIFSSIFFLMFPVKHFIHIFHLLPKTLSIQITQIIHSAIFLPMFHVKHSIHIFTLLQNSPNSNHSNYILRHLSSNVSCETFYPILHLLPKTLPIQTTQIIHSAIFLPMFHVKHSIHIFTLAHKLSQFKLLQLSPPSSLFQCFT